MKLATILAAGLATTALASAPAMAQPGMGQGNMEQAQERWKDAMNETVSATRIMSGEVTDGFTTLGDIDNLILSSDGAKIEYVLYEVPYASSFFGEDDGFVRWDNIAIERGAYSGLDLRIDGDGEAYAKQQLEITKAEADDRLVDRIVGGDMMFADGEMREIDDILFDPETGMITNYVVEFDEDSLFDQDTRLVPASMVSLDENRGVWMATRPVSYQYEVWIY